jgi:hypothetical protein
MVTNFGIQNERRMANIQYMSDKIGNGTSYKYCKPNTIYFSKNL